MNTFHGNVGWLMGLVVGLIIPIKIYSLALSLPSLVFMALCWWLPESPIWLLGHKGEKETIEALKWLR